MLIKKDIWDLISTEPYPSRENPGIWVKKVKKDQIAVDIAQQIIWKGVSNQIAFNIMDIKDLK